MSTFAQPRRKPVAGVDYKPPVVSGAVRQMTVVANPTDVFAISLSNWDRAIALREISIEGLADTSAEVELLIQRSPNGGLPGSLSNPAAVNIDSFDASPAATFYALLANRTSNGDGISNIRPVLASRTLKYRSSAADGRGVVVRFGHDNAKPPILRTLNEFLVVNLAGQVQPAGAKLTIHALVEVLRLIRIAMVGDSTTSNAFPGLLNGAVNLGGIGEAGTFNAQATVDNFGSNGYRLYDLIMNTNGVTFPLWVILSRLPDIIVLSYLINDIRTGLCSLNQAIAMLETAIYLIHNGASANQIYKSPRATSFAIQSATWSGGTVTVTTAQPHGWQVGGQVNALIEGMTPAGYNGYYALTITGANTFTYALASNPGAATVLGTATYAMRFANAHTAQPDARIILWGPYGFTADDAGDGPFRFLSAAGNTTLSGLWTGMTLAQAAQAASQMLYDAYQAFADDPRVTVVQKQDLTMRAPSGTADVYVFPTFRGVANNADTPTAGTLATTMKNQIHASQRGDRLSRRQIVPYLQAAIDTVFDRIVS